VSRIGITDVIKRVVNVKMLVPIKVLLLTASISAQDVADNRVPGIVRYTKHGCKVYTLGVVFTVMMMLVKGRRMIIDDAIVVLVMVVGHWL
jgi:hypothetical protein